MSEYIRHAAWPRFWLLLGFRGGLWAWGSWQLNDSSEARSYDNDSSARWVGTLCLCGLSPGCTTLIAVITEHFELASTDHFILCFYIVFTLKPTSHQEKTRSHPILVDLIQKILKMYATLCKESALRTLARFRNLQICQQLDSSVRTIYITAIEAFIHPII